MQIFRNKLQNISFCSLFTFQWLFFFFWLILALFLYLKITEKFSSFIFGISTILIFSHVFYGGYFLFKKEIHIDILFIFLTFLIYFCLILLIQNITYPLLWFFWLQVTFFLTILFHLYYKSKLRQVYLKEFCNYKLYIEIYGIILCSLGILLYSFFPSKSALWSILLIFCVIKFNFNIFKKKRLYSIYYQTPDISRTPFISIVIIAYNEEQYIGKLLESIKAQDCPRFEVIIVDDHSTDRTVEIVKSFASQFPLKIVQKNIRGASGSRNYGASFAQGEIILFLDADVILPSTFISNNLKTFIEQRLSIAGVDFIAITENKIDQLTIGIFRTWLKIVQYFNPRGIGFCLFVYHQLHKKVLFDETIIMSEDFNYVRRAAQNGKFRIINTVPLRVSWRRFYQENRFLLILKYLVFEWYRQNIGEIRKKILTYRFGDFNILQK